MDKATKYLRLAAEYAEHGDAKDARRQYRVGAIGLRNDGTTVSAYNIPCRRPHPEAHAEARLIRKLDFGAVVFVARIGRDGEFKLAKPCSRCRSKMAARRVRRCYYSIGPGEYGVLDL
jgi:cytidine deaminase